MTHVTERRWRCDLCNNVSPAYDIGDEPKGWTEIYKMVKFAAGFDGGWYEPEYKHFCCDDHRQQWEKLQEPK